MLAINQPYSLLILLSGIIPAGLAAAILIRRQNLGSRAFFALMAGAATWALISLFEIHSNDLPTQIFSYLFKHVFIVYVPVAWLAFSLFYSHRIRTLKWRYIALLMMLPTVTLILVSTNGHHHLVFEQFERFTFDPFDLIRPTYGPYFWVHLAYSYSLFLIGCLLLARPLRQGPTPWQETVPLIGAMVVPWVMSALSVFNIGIFGLFDLTVPAFALGGMALFWGTLRHERQDVAAMARDIIMEYMTEAVIVVDRAERIIDLNGIARKLAGIGRTDVAGARAAHIIGWWPDLQANDQTVGPRRITDLELQVNDQLRIYQVAAIPLRFNETLVGTLVTLNDATDAQMTQLALRESEERFKSLSENAPVIIFSLDENGRVNYVNPAWQAILGHPRVEVAGKALVAFIDEEDRTKVDQAFNQLVQGDLKAAEISIRVIHQNGSTRLFHAIAATNCTIEGRITGIIGLARDITEEKELQKQLFQSQKMEAIGTLAGGIAHDFNNLLMGIQANTSLIRIDAADNARVSKKVARIEEQIQSGAALTRQLLGYARKGKYSVSIFDLNGLIRDALNVVHRTNKGIVIHSRLTEEPALIQADQGQIELVLLNLFLNAIDAMPGGGELTVSTRSGDAMKPGQILLQVSDTGIGMDKATRGRIFEPFFTTKELGQGTGLGMASVYGVVKNHGGDIEVASEPHKGTRFTIILPSAEPATDQCGRPSSKEVQGASGGNILLVDDEPLILKYCHELIGSLGYAVVSAQDGAEAVERFKQDPQGFDLVILNMVMPGMDGVQLFETLEKIDPDIKVIITTGCAVDDRVSNLTAGGRHGCLQKPFGRADLARMIQQVLSPLPCDDGQRFNILQF